MAAAPIRKHIILTGPPGIGKTTVLKKTCNALRSRDIPVQGFYTQELKQGQNRVGFDVISLSGDRRPLARLSDSVNQRPRVGKYSVLIEQFEACAMPTITIPNGAGPLPVFVVDEIGKMELFSDRFYGAIRQLMRRNDITVLATVPVKHRISLIEEICSRPTVHLFKIERENRSSIDEAVTSAVVAAYESHQ